MKGIRTLGAVLGFIIVDSAAAQIIDVPAMPTCPTCTIEFTKVATIGSATDPVLLGEMSTPVRAGRGTFTALSSTNDQVVVFDSAGRFLRAVGRRGAGPGEFSGPTRIVGVGPGDSLFVHSRNEIAVFSPRIDYVRSRPDSGSRPGSFVFLPDGRAIRVALLSPRALEGGVALTITESTGRITGPFGAPLPYDPAKCIGCFALGVAVSSDRRSVLVTHPNQYRIDRYDMTGAVIDNIAVRGSPWMIEWSETRSGAALAGERPLPRITAPVALPDGRIVVTAIVPSRTWVAPGQPTGDGAGQITIGGTQTTVVRAGSEAAVNMMRRTARNFSTVVDVIDPARRQLLASTTIEGEMFNSIGADLFQARRVSDDGIISFDIYRLRVTIR